jgi:glycosyltransferase involved in cell wall biosynthesis
VLRGLAGADAVVAPSAWMLDRISACYGRPRRAEVIYPGRNPIFFNPYVSKDDCVLAVGRLVDAGKQVFLLTQQPHSFRSASWARNRRCPSRAFRFARM